MQQVHWTRHSVSLNFAMLLSRCKEPAVGPDGLSYALFKVAFLW